MEGVIASKGSTNSSWTSFDDSLGILLAICIKIWHPGSELDELTCLATLIANCKNVHYIHIKMHATSLLKQVLALLSAKSTKSSLCEIIL